MSAKASTQEFHLPDVRLFDNEQPLSKGCRLVLIKRQQKNTNARRIILFIHGLKSSAETWSDFLRAAYASHTLDEYDFAAFEYRTSLIGRLLPPFRKVNAVDWARVLADTLQHTLLGREGYEQVVLVGHSMGGLVSKFALKDLYEEQDEKALHRIHSVFTYATPHFGSDRSLMPLRLTSYDVAFLDENSSEIELLSDFWHTHAGSDKDIDVPLRAILSASDEVVAKDSAAGALPTEHQFHVATSHTQIHRPTDSGDRRITWFCEQLEQIDKAPNVRLLAIRNVPAGERLDVRHPNFREAIMDLVFVLGVGRKDGINEGDEFQLVYDEKSEKELERATDPFDEPPWHLLEATRVEEHTSICVLRSFVYGAALERQQEAKLAMGTNEDAELDSQSVQNLVEKMFGKRARRIDAAETLAIRDLHEAKSRTNREEPGSSAWHRSQLDILDSSERFIHTYPDSPHTETAMYDRAFATKQLGRWVEAGRRFAKFVKRFPLSVSAPGARYFIEEITLREEQANDPANPSLALHLGKFLMNNGDFSDGIPIVRGVLLQHPEKLSDLDPPNRLDLFGALVATDLMGKRFATAHEIPDWYREYCNTQSWIEDAFNRIQAVEDEPLRELLTALHAGVTRDFELASAAAQPQ
ncbi:MAG: alpha/beta fold hydrolase [Pseudomonadota bacterium]